MSIISRLTTWTIGQVLTAAALNNEFSNVTNLLNNLDAATTSWTNVKSAALTGTTSVTTVALTSTGVTTLKGSITNDAAAAGNIGEYIESVVSGVAFPASSSYGDATSISLTAGDWDVTLNYVLVWFANTISSINAGISTTTGNATTGLVLGSNWHQLQALPTSAVNFGGAIANWRQSLATTTTIYAKYQAVYNSTAPQIAARLSARRMR